VDVPVTLDAESGYGLDPTELVERLLAAGVHGYNLEDSDHRAGGLVEPAVHARRIAALRAAADAAGVPLVLNARVDVFHDLEDPEAHIAAIPQALDRACRYLDAGADCVYPILASEPAAAAVVAGLPGANVNLLVDASIDDIDGQVRRATDVGAARISMGPSVWAVQQRSLASLLAGLPR
jgi:2-methylisocitrate lyase-like PEP mutase family enzyme